MRQNKANIYGPSKHRCSPTPKAVRERQKTEGDKKPQPPVPGPTAKFIMDLFLKVPVILAKHEKLAPVGFAFKDGQLLGEAAIVLQVPREEEAEALLHAVSILAESAAKWGADTLALIHEERGAARLRVMEITSQKPIWWANWFFTRTKEKTVMGEMETGTWEDMIHKIQQTSLEFLNRELGTCFSSIEEMIAAHKIDPELQGLLEELKQKIMGGGWIEMPKSVQ